MTKPWNRKPILYSVLAECEKGVWSCLVLVGGQSVMRGDGMSEASCIADAFERLNPPQEEEIERQAREP